MTPARSPATVPRATTLRRPALRTVGLMPLVALAVGCGGPPPLPTSADEEIVAAPDSVSLEAFMRLPPPTRELRRERAEGWLRQAGRRGAARDRARALGAAAGQAPDLAEIWLDLAEIHRDAGAHLSADAALDRAATAIRRWNDPDYDREVTGPERDRAARRTALLRAWLHYDRAEWRQGLDWARAAETLDSGDQHALLIRGLLHASLGKWSDAHAAADQLRRQNVFTAAAAWILAMLDVARGDHRAAFDTLKDRQPADEHVADCWRDMGRVAEYLGEWSYAERWYEESHAALPLRRALDLRRAAASPLKLAAGMRELPFWVTPDRHYVTGSLSAYTRWALERFDASTGGARKAWGGEVVNAAGILLRRGEDAAWARRARGLVFVAEDRTDRGLQDLRRANRALDGALDGDAAVRAALGHAWLARERHDRALPHLEAAVRLEPGLAGAWADLGLAHVMSAATARAREALDRALALDPRLATAWYNRGLLNLHADLLPEAEADLARAAALAPGNAEIAQLLQQVRQLRRQAADGS